MNRTLLLISFSLILASCSNQHCETNISENHQLADDSIEVLLKKDIDDRIKANPKLADLREAGIKMAKYLSFDGEKYIIELTESEAAKLGISSECYQYQISELNKTNEIIANAKANGDSIALLDIKDFMTKH